MGTTKVESKLWTEFTEGITRPSLGALLGTVAVALALLAACITGITPEFMGTRGYGYFSSGPIDTYANLTAEALHLRAEGFEGTPLVVLGASSMREAISDPSSLAKAVGPETDARLLSAGSLSVWEMGIVLEQLPEQLNGTVALELSPRRLATPPERIESLLSSPNFPLHAEWVDERAREAGLDVADRSGSYFLEHFKFFVARPGMLTNVLRGPVQARRHFAETWRLPTEDEFERIEATAGRWMAGYRDNRDFNLAFYRDLARRLQARGATVVLIESLSNPEVDSVVYASQEAQDLLQEYRRDAQALADELSLAFLKPGLETQFSSTDFHDHTHLRAMEARERFTAALGSGLARAVGAGKSAEEQQ